MLNKLIANILPHMPKKLVWIFSKRYIAGETIEEGILASKLLNEIGIKTTIDLLGEFIETIDEAEANKNHYIEIINRCTIENIKGNFSLKPTMFGLLIDKNICKALFEEENDNENENRINFSIKKTENLIEKNRIGEKTKYKNEDEYNDYLADKELEMLKLKWMKNLSN